MSVTVSVLENFDIYGCFAYIIHNDRAFTLFAPSYLGSIWKDFKTENEAKLEFDKQSLYLFDPAYPPEWSDFFVPPVKGNFLPTHHKIAYLKNAYHFFEDPTFVYVLDCLRNHKRFRLVAISVISNRLICGDYFDSIHDCFKAFQRDFGSDINMISPVWFIRNSETAFPSTAAVNTVSCEPTGLPGVVATECFVCIFRNATDEGG